MKTIAMVFVLIYVFVARKNKWFPFEEEKKQEVKPVTLKDFSTQALRKEYYSRIFQSTNRGPELIKLESEFVEAINAIDTLVHIEYPSSMWNFDTKNVGSGLVLSTCLEINIVTFDGTVVKRTVEIENHKAVRLTPIYNSAAPVDAGSPEEVFWSGTDSKKEEKTEKTESQEEIEEEIPKESSDEYVRNWVEKNYDYIEEIQQKAADDGNGSILIKKEMYDNDYEQEICEFLMVKWGFEACSSTKEGIVASFYTEY